MSRGTPSMGKHNKSHTHIRCRRCGNNAFHKRLDRCASVDIQMQRDENIIGLNAVYLHYNYVETIF